MSEREERVILHDKSGEALAYYGRDEAVSVFILKWFWHVPRAKLCFVEGTPSNYLDAQDIIMKAKKGEKPEAYANDWPRTYEITCYPEDLVQLAKKMLEMYNSD